MDEERFTEPYQDPGWGVVFATRPGDEGVAAIRRLFLMFLLTPFVILIVVFFVFEGVGEMSFPLAALLFSAGVFGIGAAAWASRRPLPSDDPASLAQVYRTNLFVGFALNETPLMLAFALCFVEEAYWPYLIVFPMYLIGMAQIAPSPRNLERIQQQIHRSGSSLQLGRALTLKQPSPG